VTDTIGLENPDPFMVNADPLLVILVIVGKDGVNVVDFPESVTVNTGLPTIPGVVHTMVVGVVDIGLTVYPGTVTTGLLNPAPVIVYVVEFFSILDIKRKIDV